MGRREGLEGADEKLAKSPKSSTGSQPDCEGWRGREEGPPFRGLRTGPSNVSEEVLWGSREVFRGLPRGPEEFRGPKEVLRASVSSAEMSRRSLKAEYLSPADGCNVGCRGRRGAGVGCWS